MNVVRLEGNVHLAGGRSAGACNRWSAIRPCANPLRLDDLADTQVAVGVDVEASNAAIEVLLQAEHARATALIETHREALLALVDELMEHGQVTPPRFAVRGCLCG